jgi:hypothetical protein
VCGGAVILRYVRCGEEGRGRLNNVIGIVANNRPSGARIVDTTSSSYAGEGGDQQLTNQWLGVERDLVNHACKDRPGCNNPWSYCTQN